MKPDERLRTAPAAISDRCRAALADWGRLEWTFLALALVALAMRLWGLDGRAMHYDEALHLHYAWNLAQGEAYSHEPWMHGPLQMELVALVLRFLGDNAFLARLPYALFGVVLVVLPYFLRNRIGRAGSVCAAAVIAFSPSVLYFSRFGRNDVLMAVWAVSLLIMLDRYGSGGRRIHLLAASALTALMLASKETAYFIILFLGLASAGLGWRALWEFVWKGRALSSIDGPAGFFILLATLALPQSAAMFGWLLEEPTGLTLLMPHDEGMWSQAGLPVWEAPFAVLPAWAAPAWLHFAAAAALAGAGAAFAFRFWKLRGAAALASVAGAALLAAAGVSLVVRGAPAAVWAAPLLLAAAAFLMRFRLAAAASWPRTVVLLGAAAFLSALWLLACWGGGEFVAGLVPREVPPEQVAEGAVAWSYLAAFLILLVLLAVSAAVGIAWAGGAWLGCAAVFYGVWTLLYTTAFTNWPGVFTGSWQGLGYWMMQQEVARGGQPWYYYFLGLSVYELPALCFGLAGAAWMARRREPFGLVLAAWAVITLGLYTIASEKMPWLLMSIAVPLALVAGKLLGHLAEGVDWRQRWWRTAAPMALAPALAASALWTAWLAVGGGGGSPPAWAAGLALLLPAGALAWSLRSAPRAGRTALLGLGGALLAFSGAGAVRAAYTYDDSFVELLVYAQGAADLKDTYETLKREALADSPPPGAVLVDWELRYPFQWYIRGETRDSILKFDYFCPHEPECRNAGGDVSVRGYVTEKSHETQAPGYRREGPFTNMVWHPEPYKRPEGPSSDEPFPQRFRADLAFLWETARDRDKWRAAIEYFVARRTDIDWSRGEYYKYLRDAAPSEEAPPDEPSPGQEPPDGS